MAYTFTKPLRYNGVFAVNNLILQMQRSMLSKEQIAEEIKVLLEELPLLHDSIVSHIHYMFIPHPKAYQLEEDVEKAITAEKERRGI